MLHRLKACVIYGIIFIASPATMYCTEVRADVVRCSFTEPYVTMTYDTSTNILEIKSDVDKSTERIENVSLEIIEPSVFQLWTKDGKPLVQLDLSREYSSPSEDDGADQPSDANSNNTAKYPFTAHWNYAYPEPWDIKTAVWGGCSSNHIPSQKTGKKKS